MAPRKGSLIDPLGNRATTLAVTREREADRFTISPLVRKPLKTLHL